MKRLAQFVLVVLLVAGCPKRSQLVPPPDPGTGLRLALVALDSGKFREAEERLTFLIFNFPGSREAADAQYYLGETYFRKHRYEQAQTEFDFYLKSFPNGRFQEEATYRLGLSYLLSAPSTPRDQTLTFKAKEVLEEFLALYPDSGLRSQVEAALSDIMRRLASRDFDIALLYFRSGEFRSALTYYEYILTGLPIEKWTGPDRLRFAICCRETGQSERARAEFEALQAGDFPKEIRQAARAELRRFN